MEAWGSGVGLHELCDELIATLAVELREDNLLNATVSDYDTLSWEADKILEVVLWQTLEKRGYDIQGLVSKLDEDKSL